MTDERDYRAAKWLEHWTFNEKDQSSSLPPPPPLPTPPLAGFVLGSLEFQFSAMLVNSQLVYLLPVGILNHVMFHLNSLFHYP